MERFIKFVNEAPLEELVLGGMIFVIVVVALIKYIREELKED